MSPRLRGDPLPINPITRHLGELITTAGLSEVAARSGYEITDLRQWLSGRRKMSIEVAIDLAQTVGYDIYLEPARIFLPNPLKGKPNV